MSTELHAKVLGFLVEQFGFQKDRSCVRVDLLYSQKGFRDEEIRRWDRADKPELFETMVLIEQLTSAIIEIAETHADSFGHGSHRYVVRTHAHAGGRATESFLLKPSFEAGSDPTAMVPGGGAAHDAMGILTQNNMAFMRINAQMFQSSFSTLANLTDSLRAENTELRTENIALRREVEDSRSTRMDREFQFAMATEKNQRTNKATEKILQIGTVIAAKITGTSSELGAPDGLTMLLTEFGKSLRKDQIAQFVKVFDQGQLIMFFEIMNMVAPQEGAPGAGQGAQGKGTAGLPPGPNGAH
jgi:hypothetical protein